MKELDAIYLAARELTPEDQPAYLTRVCGSDNALRSRAEQMLAVADEAEAFITDVPDDESNDRKTEVGPAETHKLEPVHTEGVVGQRIGRYKILERVGEGGCGVVYVAEQTEPVRRRVALKVIKLGMDTRNVIARFDAERQALAMMDHPNIAKVLDAGATETGRPYFVMELVRGIRITDYCDQHNLSTKDRLDLFMKVCHAIQHAHQKGIIHRDIKPSNILVTLHDGVPVPKVIDFGIAKATEGRLSDLTIYTEMHQFIGTPAYMSPEQAEMSGLDIDTRSDIYALGVLLYEILTGKTPFDAKELMAAGIEGIRKTIREKEPVRPSTKLATLQRDELTTTAKQRASDVPKLIHLVQGDLDWIAMKCLEKDRTRRYDTAIALAADVQRHLNNEPVTAAAPTFRYRAAKFCRRYRKPLAVAAAFAVLLTAATAVSIWQAVRATQAEAHQARLRAQAEADERRARETAKQNERMATVLGGMVRTLNPLYWMEQGVEGWNEPLDALTQQAREAFAAKPEAEAEWCNLMADLYHQLVLRQKIPIKFSWSVWSNQAISDPDSASANVDFQSRWVDVSRRCLELNRSLHSGDHPALAQSLARLGNALSHGGKLQEAEAHLNSAVAMYRRLGGAQSAAFARALSHHAIALRRAGMTNAAQSTFREAVGLWAPLTEAASKPDDSLSEDSLWIILMGPQAHLSLAKVLWNRDFPVAAEWELVRVEQLCKPENDLRTQLRQGGPDVRLVRRGHSAISDTVKWAELLGHTGLRRDKLLRDALALERQERGPSHRLVRSLRQELLTMEWPHQGMSKSEDYESLLREEPAYVRQQFAGDTEAMERHLEVLAQDYSACGAPAQAIALLREVRESRNTRLPVDDPNVARVVEALAGIFALARHYQQNDSVTTTAMAGRSEQFRRWVRDAFLKIPTVEPHEMATLYCEALPGARKLYQGNPQKLAFLLRLTAQALEQDGQLDEAKLLRSEASQILPARTQSPVPPTSSTNRAMGIPSRTSRQSASRPVPSKEGSLPPKPRQP